MILPRPMITYLKNKYGTTPLVGVEIGVETGEHAIMNQYSIMNTLNMKSLYLIDPWMNGSPLDDIRYQYVSSLAKHYGNITVIRKKSEEAIDEIPDGLDFIYIDGDHSYEGVKKDLSLYYPKLKRDGVIGGHDFVSEDDTLGVAYAVVEFRNQTGLCLYGYDSDWWFVKGIRKGISI
jgi:hypothetical protein